ncbi:MAG: hypothetical protein IK008_04695 [Bacteroidales bacterium]|nr:hypothetical protein [Bacteroidales bacterium]
MACNPYFVQFIVDQCSGAGDHFYITNVDDRDYLEDIVRATVPELMSH